MYDPATHATAHFSWSELDPAGTAGPMAKANLHTLANNVLEPLRSHYGKPVHITSGYRSVALQQQLYAADIAAHGGSPSGEVAAPGHSQHELGTAADVWIEGVSPNSVAGFFAGLGGVGGIGVYQNFTHVDIRPRGADGAVARW